MPVTIETFATLAETTTTADPGSGGTSLAVTSRTVFPQSGQFRILVQDSETSTTNREVMLVTAGFGSGAGSFTVTRGIEGTAGVAHASGSYVAQVLTADALERWAPNTLKQPRQWGFTLWTHEITINQSLASIQASLAPRLVRAYVPETVTITTMYTITGSTAGATLVAGSNRMGVYDSAGTLLRQTNDITAWPASSLVSGTLTSSLQITGGPDVWVWFAIMTSATTRPTLYRQMTPASVGIANGLLGAGVYMFGSLAAVTSGQGFAASFTPSTDLTAGLEIIWLGAN